MADNKIYRVVREDGSLVGTIGRGSDPFTNKAAAKRRATELTNGSIRFHGEDHVKYKVQVAEPTWEDLDESS